MDGEHIRDRLLAYRASRGWSQARTAEESGVSNATVAHIESGFSPNPRRITLMKFAQGFGVSLDEFLSDNPPKAAGPSFLPRLLLRNRAGHDFLTHSLAETVAFATSASQDEIRARLRDLSEEQAVMREALRHMTEYVPELFGPPPNGKKLPRAKDIGEVKRAKKEIRAVAGGFVLRVRVLAEIGATQDVLAEAERILLETEHAAV